MNHFRSLIRGVVTKDCEIFKTRSSVLEICETLNNGVFIEKKKNEDMLGQPRSGLGMERFRFNS